MSELFPANLHLRCLTESPNAKPVAAQTIKFKLDGPSPWALIFDCETTTDPSQRLRVGFYQVRNNGTLHEEGVFFDERELSDGDIASVLAYADARNLKTLSLEQFRNDVFLKVGYRLGGSIIGFNLPFDLSRLAIGHGSARKKKFRGGFSLILSWDKTEPRIRIKHLNRRSALINFGKPGEQLTGRSSRKRGEQREHCEGYFFDVKTISAALTSRGFSLDGLCDYLQTQTRKLQTEEHGGPITEQYLDYARADVQATWECFVELRDRYTAYGLEKPLHRILSEASIGKACLAQMGIKPLLQCVPDMDRGIFAKLMCGYYGGRAEVKLRRLLKEVLYCDFKSMYPTVNALMGLWRFVIADGFSWHDATTQTQAFLNTVTRDDLQQPESWKHLHTIVRIKPQGDIVPVRTKYNGRTPTIGLNHLHCDQSIWFTLADVVASKILNGQTPVIEEAISFVPGPLQTDLKPIDLLGNPAYRVDPLEDDVFTRMVDLRDEAKAKGDPAQLAIKIITNAICYGIFIEIQRDDVIRPEALNVWGPDGTCKTINETAIEEPGKYFNPLLGVLITGAARLMLALTERLTLDQGLEWVFCDTDSLALAKPDGMAREEFIAKGQEIINWFKPLNPYRKAESILKLEDVNFGIGSDALEPLHAWAISAKRYALFNVDVNRKPIIRKASAHGLGYLMDPYPDSPNLKTPKPHVSLSEIGVKRWHHDLWFKIIEAALNGTPNKLCLDWHPALQQPALSRYSATSPDLLKYMRRWNEGRDYADQVTPFCFMVMPMARSGVYSDPEAMNLTDAYERGRPRKKADVKPVAPFDPNPEKAIAQTFDRETGQPIDPTQLMTYAKVLPQYHLGSEDKFEGAEFGDQGETQRRHIVATGFRLIGKEANKVGESGEAEPCSTQNTFCIF